MDNLYNGRTKPAIREGKDQAKKRMKKKVRNKNDPLKIVYIPSPLKVKTSESKFRSVVQELTGKDSQVDKFMKMSSSHAGKGDKSHLLVGDSGSMETDWVVEKVEQLEPCPVNSDQSLSLIEEELERYVMHESFAVGGSGWEWELPWHLLAE